MTPQDICYLDATELLERYKDRRLSPVEVLKAYIEQDEKIGALVNPFSHRFYDAALIKARQAEQKYFHGKSTRKLEGLPIAIKDETLVKGMPCTSGSLINKDYIADVTSIENSRILRAGGIIHARTTTPEFFPAPVIPIRACTASPAIPGTRLSRPAVHPVVPPPRWQPG